MYFTIRLYGRVALPFLGCTIRKSFGAFPSCGLIAANDDISTKSRD